MYRNEPPMNPTDPEGFDTIFDADEIVTMTRDEFDAVMELAEIGRVTLEIEQQDVGVHRFAGGDGFIVSGYSIDSGRVAAKGRTLAGAYRKLQRAL